jgi:protein-S-isoprenylcysteine O-methyltransferase Ste14
MPASKFEFEQRFWIIGGLFGLAFGLYTFDQTNFAMALLYLVAPSINLDSARGLLWQRMDFGCGALLVFLAAALRTWATAYLRAEIVHDESQHSETLVADGPYRYVRNPLYLANLPMAAGVGVLASRLGWVVLVVGIYCFVYRLILREERGLPETQGESYRNYLKAVPRLWPALTPLVPAGAGKTAMGAGSRRRDVFLASGWGRTLFRANPQLQADVHRIRVELPGLFRRHACHQKARHSVRLESVVQRSQGSDDCGFRAQNQSAKRSNLETAALGSLSLSFGPASFRANSENSCSNLPAFL